MRHVDVIALKRDGHPLTAEAIDLFVSGVTDGFDGADLVLGSIGEFDERVWAGTGTVPAPVAADR